MRLAYAGESSTEIKRVVNDDGSDDKVWKGDDSDLFDSAFGSVNSCCDDKGTALDSGGAPVNLLLSPFCRGLPSPMYSYTQHITYKWSSIETITAYRTPVHEWASPMGCTDSGEGNGSVCCRLYMCNQVSAI